MLLQTCRWCDQERVEWRGVLFCFVCDNGAGGKLLAPWAKAWCAENGQPS